MLKEANSSVVPSVGTETATVNLVGQDSRQQQFDTPSSLVSPHAWLTIMIPVLQGRQKATC